MPNNLKKIDIIKDLSDKVGYSANYSKKIIDDHNGSMLVKSTKSVKGTEIMLKFHLVAEIKKTKNKKNVKK